MASMIRFGKRSEYISVYNKNTRMGCLMHMVRITHNGLTVEVAVGDIFKSKKGNKYEVLYITEKDDTNRYRILCLVIQRNGEKHHKLLSHHDIVNLVKLESSERIDGIDHIIRMSLINHALDTRNESLFYEQLENKNSKEE